MKEERVFAMSVARVYPLLVAKAERKGRTRAELDEVTKGKPMDRVLRNE